MSLGACIYANGQENIAVTGKGRLIGPAQGGSVRKQVMDTDVIENVVPHTKPVAFWERLLADIKVSSAERHPSAAAT